jgi:hypothetical protein
MAAVKPTITTIDVPGGSVSVKKVVWNGLNSTNNIGTPVSFPGFADRTVQINGTFNNATVVLEGSLEEGGAGTYFTLTDPQGNAISKTTAAGEAITELTQYVRPNCTGGNNVQDVTVTMLLRMQNPLRT